MGYFDPIKNVINIHNFWGYQTDKSAETISLGLNSVFFFKIK